MSLPISEPVPGDVPQRPPAYHRRGRRPIIPAGSEEKTAFLNKFARRTALSFDFFLFSLLAGAIIAVGILLDSPTLFFLGALAAPFMAPYLGLSLSSVLGSGWLFLQTLSGTLIGAGLVFLTGGLAGLASYLFPGITTQQSFIHSQINLTDFIVISLGMIVFVVTMSRTEQKPLLPSVVLAYELFLPVGIAGYGLCVNLLGGTSNLWPSALITFIFYFTWSVFLGIITLWVMGVRPLNLFGYVFGILVLVIAILVGLYTSGYNFLPGDNPTSTIPIISPPNNTNTPLPSTLTPTQKLPTSTPFLTTLATPTITSTPTNTLVPTNTPTETLTPEPTPVWAIVMPNNGAYVRETPSAGAKIVDGVMGGSLVQVLPDTAQNGGIIWAHIITNNGITGWIVQSILVTATPAPTW